MQHLSAQTSLSLFAPIASLLGLLAAKGHFSEDNFHIGPVKGADVSASVPRMIQNDGEGSSCILFLYYIVLFS